MILEKHDTTSSGGVIKNPQAQISRAVVIKRKKEFLPFKTRKSEPGSRLLK
jgi:hypothetical protein